MEYWHQVGKDQSGHLDLQSDFYRHSDESLADVYPEDSPEELKEKFNQLERHEAFI